MLARHKAPRIGAAIGLLLALTWFTVARAQESIDRRLSIGTGFIVSTDGAIISSAHVIDGCQSVDVRQNGASPVSANAVRIDRQLDLVLLRAKLPNAARPLPLRAEPGPQLGERVYLLGFPLQRPLLPGHASFFESVVSGMSGIRGDLAVFRIQALVLPGTSGAPVLDAHGRVIGIIKTHLIETARNGGVTLGGESFAIPGVTIAKFARGEARIEQLTPGAPISPIEIAKHALSSTVEITCHKDEKR